MIRDRRSSGSKRCLLGEAFGLCPKRNQECMGSGESTNASLKLKEIDGRTPQGVECAA
jgi:hypothetical protein